jgi:hypothetical protein
VYSGSDRFYQIFYHVTINWSEGVHITFCQEKNVYGHVNMLITCVRVCVCARARYLTKMHRQPLGAR